MNKQQKRRTGKFLLYAQIPILAITVFIFSQVQTAFASGDESQSSKEVVSGFNIDIPEPSANNKMDKLSLIRKNRKDSIARAKQMKKDFGVFGENEEPDIEAPRREFNKSPNDKVAQMQAKLERIQGELEKQQNNAKRTSYGNEYSKADYKNQSGISDRELRQIDQLAGELNESDIEGASQQELQDVNHTMDKLVKVMEMARAMENGEPLESEKEKRNKENKAKEIFEIKKFNDNNSEEFFGFSDEDSTAHLDNTFKASFFNKQTLIAGSTVKIKLDESVRINDIEIAKNSFLYGKVGLSGDRLRININSVRVGDYLFPVSLTAYDYDGLEGIHVPGSIQRELAKKEASSSIRGMNFSTFSMDQGIEDKAVESGSNFLKDVFSRKVRIVKVTVRPYHKILLKNQ